MRKLYETGKILGGEATLWAEKVDRYSMDNRVREVRKQISLFPYLALPILFYFPFKLDVASRCCLRRKAMVKPTSEVRCYTIGLSTTNSSS